MICRSVVCVTGPIILTVTVTSRGAETLCSGAAFSARLMVGATQVPAAITTTSTHAVIPLFTCAYMFISVPLPLPVPWCIPIASEHKTVTPTVPPPWNAPGASSPVAPSGEGCPVGSGANSRGARWHSVGGGAMVAAIRGHGGPRGEHRLGGRGQRGKGACPIHGRAAHNGQDRFDTFDLLLGDREVVGREHRQVCQLTRHYRSLGALLARKPTAADGVEPQRFH